MPPQRAPRPCRDRSCRRRTSAPTRSMRARPVRRPGVRWRRAPPQSSRRRRAGGTVSTAKPCASARALPFQHRRGVIVLQHQHARATRYRQHLGRRRDAVADRRDQRDVAGIGVDQARGGAARALVLPAGERRHRASTAGPCGRPRRGRLPGSQRQRAVGGGIQVADVARDIEQVALRGEHACLIVRRTGPVPSPSPIGRDRAHRSGWSRPDCG